MNREASQQTKLSGAFPIKMNSLYFLTKAEFERALRSRLPDFALEDFDPAIRDEPGAGSSLVCAAPNDLRGVLAVYFWLHASDTKAFREVLSGAWDHDHREVIAATGTRRDLEAMFRAASWDLPADWPERVTLYRGTSALPFGAAKRGFSWTTSKQVAAFFAMRFAKANGTPLVLRATVPRDLILYHSDARQEAEAVCFHVRGAQIDGTPSEWHELMNQYVNDSKERTSKLLATVKAELDAEFGTSR